MNARRIGRMAAGAMLAAGAGLALLRPAMQRWGATDAEVHRILPGDDLIPTPQYVATRAITIRARAGAVWPWLVQMGQGRGGFYSYDWLENLAGLDIRSADRIIPELQHLDPGEIIRLAPHIGMAVTAIIPERALVIRSVADIRTGRPVDRGDPRFFDWSWAFILDESGEHATRLIVRERADFIPSPGMTVLGTLAFGPIDFAMSRKMLLGIKQRAEREG